MNNALTAIVIFVLGFGSAVAVHHFRTPSSEVQGATTTSVPPAVLYAREVTTGAYNRVYYLDCDNRLRYAGEFSAFSAPDVGEAFPIEFRPCEQKP